MEKTMEEIATLTKNRGFVYPGPEIYNGLVNIQDYGSLGVEPKNNAKKIWQQKSVMKDPYNVDVGYATLMNPQTWVAGGHLGGFSDPLMDCKKCKERFRTNKLTGDFSDEHSIQTEGSVDAWSQEQMEQYTDDNNICYPSCDAHDFTGIRRLNLMFKTFQGVIKDAKNMVHLRPETAQGIFVDLKNAQRTSKEKAPFGIAQVGKSFRNGITPGNFIFHTRGFEQMELELLCKFDTDLGWFAYWKWYCTGWLETLGIKDEEMHARDHEKEEFPFHSKATTGLGFLFPFGWGELWGIAGRTDYDLTQYQNISGQDMSCFDDKSKEKYIPHVIESSLGADHVTSALLYAIYDKEEIGEGDMRAALHFHPATAPVKVGVLPLSKKLNEGTEKVYVELSKYFDCEFDGRDNTGKRYRRQDEIGTPFCVTYDFDSEEDHAMTVRNRGTIGQIRIPIRGLRDYFADKSTF